MDSTIKPGQSESIEHIMDKLDKAIEMKTGQPPMGTMTIYGVNDPIAQISSQAPSLLSANGDGYRYQQVYTMIRIFEDEPLTIDELVEHGRIMGKLHLKLLDTIRRHTRELSPERNYTSQEILDMLNPEELDMLAGYRDHLRPKRQGESRFIVKCRNGFVIEEGIGVSITLYEHSDPIDLLVYTLLSVWATKQQMLESEQNNPAWRRENGDETQLDHPVFEELSALSDEDVQEAAPGTKFTVPIIRASLYTYTNKKGEERNKWSFYAPTRESIEKHADNPKKWMAHNPLRNEATVWASEEECPVTKQAFDDAILPDIASGKSKAVELSITAVKQTRRRTDGTLYDVFEILEIRPIVIF